MEAMMLQTTLEESLLRSVEEILRVYESMKNAKATSCLRYIRGNLCKERLLVHVYEYYAEYGLLNSWTSS